MKDENIESPFKTFIGALLVGGTALGAGMLALPVATAGSGLVPAWLIYFICWVFSLATGLLFVEVGLWMPQNANIVSMAFHLLGKWGRAFAWILYIFLFYCLTIAYVSGGGGLVASLLGPAIPLWVSTILFTGFFSAFVYYGTKIVGRLNVVLMVGLIVSYILFIAMGSSRINFSLLEGWGWKSAILGLPIIFTSFSYQGIIPSLLTYLNRNAKKMRVALIAGTSIPFLSYIIWDLIIKGIVPAQGPHGLIETKQHGLSAITPLQYFLQEGSYIYTVGNFFAFFALTTSFIGVTLGLLDFLSDSLQIEKTPKKKLGLCAMIYIPSIIISLINPAIFLSALGFAGGFGCVFLLGLLPVLMVWVGRYHRGYPSLCQQLPGGKLVLSLLIAFIAFEVIVEALQVLF